MYISSQDVMTGLGDVHQSVRIITQVRQLRQVLATPQELLKKSAKTPLTSEEIVILKSSLEGMDNLFAINLDLTRSRPDVYKLIADAKATLAPLNYHSLRVIAGEGRKIDSVIIDQYVLEAQDLLGKVQLVLDDDSNRTFIRLYDERFKPLIMGMILSILCLFFALWLGINLKNKIDKPIQRLIDAAKALAAGNLSVRAQIDEANEVGALTHNFNVMAGKLEESLTAAEAANQAKSAFLANMSHEIRTPLGAVIGFADLVVNQKIPPAERANFVAAIKRNSDLLSKIINDILDLSKIEAGKMQVETYEASLSEVLVDTKTLLDLQAKEKGITLNIEVEKSVPEVIKTDPLRLRQILINIIGNSVKFTSKGTVDVTVKRERGPHGRDVIAFIVKDTGSGIHENYISKLFAPFSQADDTLTRKFGGTGLGLMLAKRFANLLGGDVVLTQTIPGKGSTFTITVDAGPIHSQSEEDLKTQFAKFQGKSQPLAGIRILLAEDLTDNQVLFSYLLKSEGAIVDIAHNGKEAAEKANKEKYHVILMDLQMPVMDGYQATAQLRKEGYRGKIVALTAHALNEDREHTLNVGFDDHISKPVNRDLLIERIFLMSRMAER